MEPSQIQPFINYMIGEYMKLKDKVLDNDYDIVYYEIAQGVMGMESRSLDERRRVCRILAGITDAFYKELGVVEEDERG